MQFLDLNHILLVFVILATNNYLAIGAALAIGVYLGGNISGGAYNPAVAIALMASGKIPGAEVIPYIIAEIMGALVAFEMVKLI